MAYPFKLPRRAGWPRCSASLTLSGCAPVDRGRGDGSRRIASWQNNAGCCRRKFSSRSRAWSTACRANRCDTAADSNFRSSVARSAASLSVSRRNSARASPASARSCSCESDHSAAAVSFTACPTISASACNCSGLISSRPNNSSKVSSSPGSGSAARLQQQQVQLVVARGFGLSGFSHTANQSKGPFNNRRHNTFLQSEEKRGSATAAGSSPPFRIASGREPGPRRIRRVAAVAARQCRGKGCRNRQ